MHRKFALVNFSGCRVIFLEKKNLGTFNFWGFKATESIIDFWHVFSIWHPFTNRGPVCIYCRKQLLDRNVTLFCTMPNYSLKAAFDLQFFCNCFTLYLRFSAKKYHSRRTFLTPLAKPAAEQKCIQHLLWQWRDFLKLANKNDRADTAVKAMAQ